MILKNDIEHTFQVQQTNLQINGKLIEREFLARFKPTGKHIEVISGIRRSGKSTLMKQIIQRNYKKTAYFNFEDARVFGFEVNDFTKLDEYTAYVNTSQKPKAKGLFIQPTASSITYCSNKLFSKPPRSSFLVLPPPGDN